MHFCCFFLCWKNENMNEEHFPQKTKIVFFGGGWERERFCVSLKWHVLENAKHHLFSESDKKGIFVDTICVFEDVTCLWPYKNTKHYKNALQRTQGKTQNGTFGLKRGVLGRVLELLSVIHKSCVQLTTLFFCFQQTQLCRIKECKLKNQKLTKNWGLFASMQQGGFLLSFCFWWFCFFFVFAFVMFLENERLCPALWEFFFSFVPPKSPLFRSSSFSYSVLFLVCRLSSLSKFQLFFVCLIDSINPFLENFIFGVSYVFCLVLCWCLLLSSKQTFLTSPSSNQLALFLFFSWFCIFMFCVSSFVFYVGFVFGMFSFVIVCFCFVSCFAFRLTKHCFPCSSRVFRSYVGQQVVYFMFYGNVLFFCCLLKV